MLSRSELEESERRRGSGCRRRNEDIESSAPPSRGGARKFVDPFTCKDQFDRRHLAAAFDQKPGPRIEIFGDDRAPKNSFRVHRVAGFARCDQDADRVTDAVVVERGGMILLHLVADRLQQLRAVANRGRAIGVDARME
jgi:hypothetical protein